MSIFDALILAGIIVCATIALLCGIGFIIAFLSVLKPIGWILLVILLLTIGIHQYDKHYLN